MGVSVSVTLTNGLFPVRSCVPGSVLRKLLTEEPFLSLLLSCLCLQHGIRKAQLHGVKLTVAVATYVWRFAVRQTDIPRVMSNVQAYKLYYKETFSF